MMSGILTKCEVCKKELDGVMLFYPTLCLLWANSCNLRYERSYFFRGDGVDRFLKNYDFVCDNPTNDFFVDVLANKKLKNEFTWGLKTNGRLGISKDEFFNKVKGVS